MASLRKVAVPFVSSLLLLAVVITVHNDVKYRSLHPNAATAELLGVPAAAGTAMVAKTSHAQAALKNSALKSNLASVDVDGAVSAAVVQKLAGAMVKGSTRKPMKKADVVKAAEDITKVIEDGKQDDESVKTVLKDSETHGGKDSGSASLFKELHEAASVKKGKKSLSLSAEISTSLDVGKAHNTKQIKMAHVEALAIAKVLQQSKADLGAGKIIRQHSKSTGGTKDWDNFWGSKHSLVSRLAAQVGVGNTAPKAASKKGGKPVVLTKAQAVKKAQVAMAAEKAHEAKMAQVPEAIRKMWDLLKAAKAQKK